MNARGDSDPPAGTGDLLGASGVLPPSDSHFRSVVDAANEGIWTIDLEGRTVFANRRMAAMLGIAPEEMVGRTPFDFLVEEDFALARDIIQRSLGGNPIEFEIRFRRADGSILPTLAGSAPLRDEQGRITGSVAMFSDLSARQAAEQALVERESEAKATAALLNHLLESATDAIWLRDRDGIFQLANPAARSIMNADKVDVVGRSVFEIWGKEIGARLAAEAEGMFRARQGVTVEEEMFDAGSNRVGTFLSNKVPLFAPDGSPIGIVGISRDITDRKRVEIELRESRAELAQQVAELNALYGSAPIGLAFFDRDYRYLRINQELASANGLPVEEHYGRTVRDVLPGSAEAVEAIIARIFETGESIRDLEITGEAPHRPGITRHWLTGFYPVMDDRDEVKAVGAWAVEISERKAAEQRELLLAREVDHRAKNLLAVVQSIVTLTPAVDGEDLKSSVVGRIQALARAHSLLSDSRWEGVDLGQLIAEELAPFARDDAHRLRIDGPPFTLRPTAAQSLALVLHELATNAAKYGALSTGSGQVRVEWGRDRVDGRPSLIIRWEESGGPPVTAPQSFSFGSNIIRASVERQLRGKVAKDWRAEGLLCVLQIPAVEVLPGPAPDER